MNMLSIFHIISMNLLYIYIHAYILKMTERHIWLDKENGVSSKFPVLDTYIYITQHHKKNISVQRITWSTLLWIWSSMIAVQNWQLSHHLFISHYLMMHTSSCSNHKGTVKIRSQVQYKHLKFLIAAFMYGI